MAGPHELGHDFALLKKDKNKSLAPTWASCKSGVQGAVPCSLRPRTTLQRTHGSLESKRPSSEAHGRAGNIEINVNN